MSSSHYGKEKRTSTAKQSILSYFNKPHLKNATLHDIGSSSSKQPVLEHDFNGSRGVGSSSTLDSHGNSSGLETGGWEWARYLAQVEMEDLQEKIRTSRFLALSLDEVTAIDHTSWVNSSAENLFEVVIKNLKDIGGMSNAMIAQKLVCVGADGAFVMQGQRNGLCVRIDKSKEINMSCIGRDGILCVAVREYMVPLHYIGKSGHSTKQLPISRDDFSNIVISVKSTLTNIARKLRLQCSRKAICRDSSPKTFILHLRIGEFPFWFHQMWTTPLQLVVALGILFHAVGLPTFSALVVIILTMMVNSPLAKLQHKFQTELMSAQDEQLRATSEALVHMKVLKLHAWEEHFREAIEKMHKDADIYLLDDPFSVVDAHTATSLFRDYVMRALSKKTVILVTHQVDFLPAFDSILELVNAHKDSMGSNGPLGTMPFSKDKPVKNNEEIQRIRPQKEQRHLGREPKGDQLIKQEETGDTGLKPYIDYLKQNKGFLYCSFAALSHLTFITGQILRNTWIAAKVQSSQVSYLLLITVYIAIGFTSSIFLFLLPIFVVILGLQASKSLFFELMTSLFRAPMAFFDSTPLGRILSRHFLTIIAPVWHPQVAANPLSQGSKTSHPPPKATTATSKPGAYRPPHAKSAAAVNAQTIEQNALKNKKKREKQKEKKALEASSGNSS
eukprot:Gb_14268 [translate_table: standard]